VAFQGEQANFCYPPEHIGKAFSKERLGGACFFNLCADGETLLTKRIDEYLKAIVEQGHYIEIVSNMTVTPVIDRILTWDKDLLERTEFKCSFHYLELKNKGLLDVFADNVNRSWASGASASVEITPADELIPHIDECTAFSMKRFGALPQLTIARNDATIRLEYLTKLSREEYRKVWSRFDSPFWRFKTAIFKKRRKEFCYSGAYSLFVNLATGKTGQCYICWHRQNIFEDLSKPIEFLPVGRCCQPHCYNGHALLTMGMIPGKFADMRFGSNIRDRVRSDGTHWLNEKLRAFFDGRCDENNERLTGAEERKILALSSIWALGMRLKQVLSVVYHAIKKKLD
jgi:hypothetical protein